MRRKVFLRNGKKKKTIRRLMLLFPLMLFLAACILAGRCFLKDKEYRERFRELEKAEAAGQGKADAARHSPKGENAPNAAKKKNGTGTHDSKEKKESENPDWIGWLKIEGTTINYPVMQRKGEGEYYLHRDFDGKHSSYGTPFLDIRCTSASDNCIVYGHNIGGGRMFGALHAYSDHDFYKKHPEIWFRMGKKKKTYHIVSVMKTTTSSEIYSFTDVGNWKEYEEYVRNAIEGSLYHTETGEKIREETRKDTAEEFFRKYRFLTLSTCRTWAGKDARLLVIAARERGEE